MCVCSPGVPTPRGYIVGQTAARYKGGSCVKTTNLIDSIVFNFRPIGMVVERRTRDREVAGSTTAAGNNPGQVVHTCVSVHQAV